MGAMRVIEEHRARLFPVTIGSVDVEVNEETIRNSFMEGVITKNFKNALDNQDIIPYNHIHRPAIEKAFYDLRIGYIKQARELIGIPDDVTTRKEAKKIYLARARELRHTQQVGQDVLGADNNMFAEIKEAWDLLVDADKVRVLTQKVEDGTQNGRIEETGTETYNLLDGMGFCHASKSSQTCNRVLGWLTTGMDVSLGIPLRVGKWFLLKFCGSRQLIPAAEPIQSGLGLMASQ